MKTGKLSVFQFSLLLPVALMLAGCGSLKSGDKWGENAARSFEWKRVSTAAKNAALDPLTWVPLVGAGVVAAGDWDHDISHWATEQTPIFGSRDTARDFSDIGKTVLIGEGVGTALLTPSGSDRSEWFADKGRGLLVEGGAFGLTLGVTEGLKAATRRERPDHKEDNAMPSGHTSESFSAAVLANRNLDCIDINPYARMSLKAANVGLATSIAWARVEGERHFPTDVFVGAALGNFLTRFIHDSFMGLDKEDRFSFYIEPGADGGKVFLSWGF
jgi:membrane-associated phospholipid phosphatase